MFDNSSSQCGTRVAGWLLLALWLVVASFAGAGQAAGCGGLDIRQMGKKQMDTFTQVVRDFDRRPHLDSVTIDKGLSVPAGLLLLMPAFRSEYDWVLADFRRNQAKQDGSGSVEELRTLAREEIAIRRRLNEAMAATQASVVAARACYEELGPELRAERDRDAAAGKAFQTARDMINAQKKVEGLIEAEAWPADLPAGAKEALVGYGDRWQHMRDTKTYHKKLLALLQQHHRTFEQEMSRAARNAEELARVLALKPAETLSMLAIQISRSAELNKELNSWTEESMSGGDD